MPYGIAFTERGEHLHAGQLARFDNWKDAYMAIGHELGDRLRAGLIEGPEFNEICYRFFHAGGIDALAVYPRCESKLPTGETLRIEFIPDPPVAPAPAPLVQAEEAGQLFGITVTDLNTGETFVVVQQQLPFDFEF